MRVNIYAEEMTDRIEIVKKTIDGNDYTGLRFYLELPVTTPNGEVKGPFIHRPGDDDSSAVTFWGKKGLKTLLIQAVMMLDSYYNSSEKHCASIGKGGTVTFIQKPEQSEKEERKMPTGIYIRVENKNVDIGDPTLDKTVLWDWLYNNQQRDRLFLAKLVFSLLGRRKELVGTVADVSL